MMPSISLTLAAVMLSVQVSEAAKLTVGSIVRVLPVPLTAAALAPEIEQFRPNQAPLVVTLSEKFTVTLLASATPPAPEAGLTLAIVGAASGWVKLCPLLHAPKLAVRDGFQTKLFAVVPVPESCSDCPTAPLPSSICPMLTLLSPFAAPPLAMKLPS